MEKKIGSILFIFFCIQKACCFSCFHCLSSRPANCQKTQYKAECSSTMKQPSCLTISYFRQIEDVNETKIRTVYQKKCVDLDMGCSFFCESMRFIKVKRCKVLCCRTKNCNNAIEKNWSRSEKRSFAERNGTSNFIVTTICLMFGIFVKTRVGLA